jgi:hypothetical protein
MVNNSRVKAELSRYIATARTTTDVIDNLRSAIYRNAKLGPGNFNKYRPSRELISVLRGQRQMLCWGMAEAYVHALSIEGVPARIVQLYTQRFLDGEDADATHVTVEVYDQTAKKVYISDPTFNAVFYCGHGRERLSVDELRRCNSGVRASEDQPLPGRSLAQYSIPYVDFFARAVAYPANIGEYEQRFSTLDRPPGTSR